MTRFLQLTFVLMGLTLLSNMAVAETPFPTIHEPADESLKCIHPVDDMRRNHMNYILHERDETVHKGIRNEPASLVNCLDCHVQPNEKGEIAGIESKEHYCNSCHQYASVQIDCFQCHADRPQKFIDRSAAIKTHNKDVSLKQQLKDMISAHDDSSEGANQ